MAKIVGIGLGKTGTTTLGECLRELGYSVHGFDESAIRAWRRGELEEIHKTLDCHDAFEDFPWPFLYREIDEHYPNSKFVLTRRTSAERWYQSLIKHADRTGPTPAKLWCYGYRLPYFRETHHKTFYESHLKDVRKYFAHRPNDLLEICWEEEQDWSRLADFIGVDPVNKPLPHLNKAPRKASENLVLATRAKHLMKAALYQALGRYTP